MGWPHQLSIRWRQSNWTPRRSLSPRGPLVPSQDLPIQDTSRTDHHGWVSWLCLDQNESRNTVTAPKTCHFQVGRYKGVTRNLKTNHKAMIATLLPMTIQGWFPLGNISSTTIWSCQFFGTQPFLWTSSHISHTPIVCVRMLSHVWLFATPWTVACHGIFSARVLEWIAISSSRGVSLMIKILS